MEQMERWKDNKEVSVWNRWNDQYIHHHHRMIDINTFITQMISFPCELSFAEMMSA